MLNSCRTFICLFENRSTKFRSSYRFPGNNSGKVHLVPIFFWIFSNFRFWYFLYFHRVVLWKVCEKKWSVLYTKFLRSLRNNFRSFDVLEVISVLDQLEFFFQRGSTGLDLLTTGAYNSFSEIKFLLWVFLFGSFVMPSGQFKFLGEFGSFYICLA